MRALAQPGLLAALSQAKIEADDPVLIAHGKDGNIPSNVVFRLDDLLRSLPHLRTVGQGEIAGDLLLNRNRGSGARRSCFRVETLRVDFDAADSE